MGRLSDWLEQLGFLVLFGSLAEMILPASGVRKVVRLVVGLVIVLAIVEPIALVIGRPLAPAVITSFPADRGAASIEAGRRLARDGLDMAHALWTARLEEELAVMISLIEGVDDVDVELVTDARGEVGRAEVALVLSSEAQASAGGPAGARDPTERAVRLIRRILPGLEADRIQVVVSRTSAAGATAALPGDQPAPKR